MPATLSLNVIDIARPCPADWDAMHGNDQVRFCDHCQLNVYNLSQMTRSAAEQLLIEKEGHLCVRLYRRMDGTVITRDCEGAWKLAVKKLSRLAALSCAAVLSGLFAPFGLSDQQAMAAGTEPSMPVKLAERWIRSLSAPAAPPVAMAGAVQPMLTGKPAPSTQPAVDPEMRQVEQGDVVGARQNGRSVSTTDPAIDSADHPAAEIVVTDCSATAGSAAWPCRSRSPSPAHRRGRWPTW